MSQDWSHYARGSALLQLETHPDSSFDWRYWQQETPMTVCIGAICKNGEGDAIILAADRMRTLAGGANVQSEPPIAKIVQLTAASAVLYSGFGDSEYLVSLLQKATEGSSFQAKSHSDLALRLYTDLRRERVEQYHLKPVLGTDFAGFRDLLTRTPFSSVLTQVSTSVTQHNIGVALLIAGQDDKFMGHLIMVDHPGATLFAGRNGFLAIGQWLPAVTYLNLRCQARDMPMFETLQNVVAAKRAAEFSQGVGKATDITVIADQHVTFLSADLVEKIVAISGQKLVPERQEELDQALNKELVLSKSNAGTS